LKPFMWRPSVFAAYWLFMSFLAGLLFGIDYISMRVSPANASGAVKRMFPTKSETLYLNHASSGLNPFAYRCCHFAAWHSRRNGRCIPLMRVFINAACDQSPCKAKRRSPEPPFDDPPIERSRPRPSISRKPCPNRHPICSCVAHCLRWRRRPDQFLDHRYSPPFPKFTS